MRFLGEIMKQLQEYIAFDLEFNTVGEHARMTARVYEKFLDLDENKIYLKQQKEVVLQVVMI